MPENAEKNRIAAFEAYLKSLGLEKFSLTEENGKYHYCGSKAGDIVAVTFDPGTIPDGTYNIFVDKGGLQWMGVLVPAAGGAYSVRKKGEDIPPPKAASPPPPPPPQQETIPAPTPPCGQYNLYMVRNAQASTAFRECGVLAIADAAGNIVTECSYVSGGFGKGSIPDLPKYALAAAGNPNKDIRPFTPEGPNPITQDGLRLANADLAPYKRSGILIHEDLGKVGTYGCLGIQGKGKWNEFANAWRAIPPPARPDAIVSVSQEEYAKMKAAGLMKNNATSRPTAQFDKPENSITMAESNGESPFDPGFGAALPTIKDILKGRTV